MKTPNEIEEHERRFHQDAWKQYSLTELGQWVALLVKRASHRTEPDKKEKDLTDAKNYLAMMKAHIDDAR